MLGLIRRARGRTRAPKLNRVKVPLDPKLRDDLVAIAGEVGMTPETLAAHALSCYIIDQKSRGWGAKRTRVEQIGDELTVGWGRRVKGLR